MDSAECKAGDDAQRLAAGPGLWGQLGSGWLHSCHVHPPAASNSLTRGRQRLRLLQALSARILAPKKSWRTSLLGGCGLREHGGGQVGSVGCGWALLEEIEVAKTSAAANVSHLQREGGKHPSLCPSVPYPPLKHLVTEPPPPPPLHKANTKEVASLYPGDSLGKTALPPA